MTTRLGDGSDGLAVTLGGGPAQDETSLGPRGSLFLGQRPMRREMNLLAVAAPRPAPILGSSSETGGGDSGDAGGGDSGDGGGGGGDGGDG